MHRLGIGFIHLCVVQMAVCHGCHGRSGIPAEAGHGGASEELHVQCQR